MFETSIPASVNINGWKELPVHAISERLVPLNGVREDCLLVQPYKENETLYVREMVMNLLILAASKLPHGVKLRVNKGWSEDAPFHTGGVVEVCLVDEEGRRLDMGEEFELRAYEDRKDTLTKEEELFLHHRRLLYHSMISVGFVAKSNVWWHFEFGTQYWGAAKNKSAFYGEISPT